MAQPPPVAASDPTPTEERVAVKVWDLPVRIVHWAFFRVTKDEENQLLHFFASQQ